MEYAKRGDKPSAAYFYLEYLCRGGRVSRTILHVMDGKLAPLEEVWGRNKVIQRMVKIMSERGKDLQEQTIVITHGDDLEAANKLMPSITQSYGCRDFIVNNIGCAV